MDFFLTVDNDDGRWAGRLSHLSWFPDGHFETTWNGEWKDRDA